MDGGLRWNAGLTSALSTRVVKSVACLGIYEAEMLGCILKDANTIHGSAVLDLIVGPD